MRIGIGNISISIGVLIIKFPIDPNRHLPGHHPLLIIIIQHISNNPNNPASIPALYFLNPLHNNLIQNIISVKIIALATGLQGADLEEEQTEGEDVGFEEKLGLVDLGLLASAGDY